ncbi:DUF1844 domain-containing protein [Rhodopirellula sp. MGV]|uniref:DUF1844 domain-containing protein n=1 Tax=Rhodopirellula sp. MGV TaxID=2023130 RepID=UPI000B966A9C|nr:DUF1844 domain-containing protein [Rhodopirellula sp. MGV]OYP29821.1 hypothetical protein CGZ80_23800 [Rhodopirellula sp. MGV]PNY33703.1 DUF1844 domain-containing protein [Rhodopirellula baltica]
MSEPNNEPELVVDNDWKSQVEKEKTAPAESPDADDPTASLPPASLAMLISTFYSQAMMALGVMANPSTNEKSTDLMMAKHFIDTLEMLQEKTKGNTDDEEDKMFDEVLHLLRMAYVGAKKG